MSDNISLIDYVQSLDDISSDRKIVQKFIKKLKNPSNIKRFLDVLMQQQNTLINSTIYW